jgi:sulfur-oxidizing protein SoxZ
MADPMRIRAALKGEITEVRVLMAHIMETGQRKDAAGATVPAHFIQQVSAKHNGKLVFFGQMGPAVSKDPFLQFSFKGGAKGDKVEVTWVDNKGATRTDAGTIT